MSGLSTGDLNPIRTVPMLGTHNTTEGLGLTDTDEKKPEATKFADENYKGDWVWDFPASK